MMKKSVWICLLSFLALLGSGAQEKNLLTNGEVKSLLTLKEYKAKYPRLGIDPGLETKIPDGWGMFRAGRKDVLWGVSPSVKYNGKNAFYMKGAKHMKSTPGKINFRYMLLGSTDGYDYRYVPALKPSTEYLFSVRVKGDVGRVQAMVISKAKGFDTPAHKANIAWNTVLQCSESEWTLLAGKFKTPARESRVALGLLAPQIAAGKVLYAADACLMEMPPLTPRKKTSAKPLAAVYAPEKDLPRFRENLVDLLQKNGFAAKLVTDLRWNTIKDLDLLVLTTFREVSFNDLRNDNISLPETDIAGNLQHFLNQGGGLILGHDCVGLRGKVWQIPIFPEICSGKEIVINAQVKPLGNSLFKGVKPFTHSYYDHVAIRVGKRGRVQAVDSKNNPVIVTGEGVRGRIAALGYPMGMNHKDRSLQDFIPEEKQIFLTAAKWASAAPKYNVPRLLTESTSAMAYRQKKNLLHSGEQQRRIDEEVKYSKLPLPRFDEISMIIANTFKDKPEALRQRIRNCRKVGFNTIKMHVNNGHALYYESKHFPKCCPPHCDFDTLRVVRDECDKLGMKFSVYIHSFAPLRNYKRPCGCNLARTVLKHEYEKIQSGEMKESELNKELLTLPNGNKRVRWECLSNEANIKRYELIVTEVIQKYKPFEINFDFVRYQSGYDTPCYCKECLKRKEAFSGKHPALKDKQLDKAYAEYELKRVFNHLFAVARKADPKVVVSCYTYADNCDWVYSYKVDRHMRYVSGRIGPDTPLSGIPGLMKKYTNLLRKYNPKAELLPLLANYDSKNARRMKAEFSLVSQGWDQIKPKMRMVEFAGYGYLFEAVGWLKRDKPQYDAINGISQALQGSWHKNEGKLLK